MTAADTRIAPAAVQAAAERIASHVRHTPLLRRDLLPGLLVKAEHLQHSGSFKLRGAANALLALGADAVVAGSSGNHGIAVATLGRGLGVRVTVVMAAGAAETKEAAVRALGGRVVRVPGGVAARDRYAKELAARTGAALVPSSDHDLVVAGQGTVGLEMLRDAPDLDAIFVPVGGGGLLAGVCLAAAHLGSAVRIIGVEPDGARRYARSLSAGRPVEVPPSDSVADGLRGQRPGEVILPIVRHRVDELIGVGDPAVLRAMTLLHRAGIPAEPSGAAALAGALRLNLPGRSAVVVSGGNSAAALAAAGAAHTGTGRRPAAPHRPACPHPHHSEEGRAMNPIDTAELTGLITDYYRETLGDDTLDATSDFFEAGGDSLAAFQIVHRLQELLDAEIAVALVFTYPSPAELAQVVVDDLSLASASA
ncbi:pyridoxal-phosphate dependent enzyme [Streptomyces asoensis]|uniref:pyridoxal-phosphate dependent enzyme n=1 Tax=Streptomyces asoensis TaxID=249586 RepID=UPI0033DD4C1B